ncbi:hypothetical protein NKH70_22910 [Mesorhizobium sp. M0991]|uniref:hypothetical protein n=1 Tax=Mesorhizobium sp. M0991 TaxID=2957043 RepID=UPI00333600D1
MSKAPKDKDQDKADQRRDDLAKRVLNTPPQPKHGKGEKKAQPKSSNAQKEKSK